MRRNNDKMLLESLVRKYGVNKLKSAVERINESLDNESFVNVDIEFWKDDSGYWAYIGEENYSGYKCSGATLDEMLEDVKEYFMDRLTDDSAFNDESDE